MLKDLIIYMFNSILSFPQKRVLWKFVCLCVPLCLCVPWVCHIHTTNQTKYFIFKQRMAEGMWKRSEVKWKVCKMYGTEFRKSTTKQLKNLLHLNIRHRHMVSTLATFYRNSWYGKAYTHSANVLCDSRHSSCIIITTTTTIRHNNFISSNSYITLCLWIMQSTLTKISSQISIKNYWNECNGCVRADARQNSVHTRWTMCVVLQFIVMIASDMKHIFTNWLHTYIQTSQSAASSASISISIHFTDSEYESTNSWNASDN